MKGDIRKQTTRPFAVKLPDDIEVDTSLLEYCEKQFKKAQGRFDILEKYFYGENKIQTRSAVDPGKPNNRIPHNFAKYISKISTAFFMGEGIQFLTEDKAYKEELDQILTDNAVDVKHYEEAMTMSEYGISFELMYINEAGKLKTQVFEAGEIWPVFSSGVSGYLSMALRPYSILDFKTHRTTQYMEVYTKELVIQFEKRSGGKWKETERFSHNFSDVPVIVRQNNRYMLGDYEDVIPLIDGYDRAQSDTSNDLDYFTNAYLALEGVSDIVAEGEDGEEMSPAEAAKTMKEDRLLMFPTGAKGYFITKPAGDNTAESHKDRLYKDIFFLSLVPNLTDEAFAGNLSGVAMGFKLFGLKELAEEKQKYFVSSEMKKIRFITEYINTLKSTNYDWRTVEIKVDRSAITNLLETAQVVNYLRDLLSDETLIGMIPGVDVTDELEKKVAEISDRENTLTPTQVMYLAVDQMRDLLSDENLTRSGADLAEELQKKLEQILPPSTSKQGVF